MSLKFKQILGVKISITNTEEVLEKTRKYLKKRPKSNLQFEKKTIKPLIIFTPNPEIINYAQKDNLFRQIVNSAQINLPDGSGVVWAFRKVYRMKIRAVTGVEIVKKICQQAAEMGLTIGIIGGREGLAVTARECLRKTQPKLKIEALGEPEVRIEEEAGRLNSLSIIGDNREEYFKDLVKKINRKRIDYLFVALGFPKQEYFIGLLSGATGYWPGKRPLVMMGVGGSFDYIAGRIPRAPTFLRQRGLEWLYRLIRQPWRIKRHIIGSKFFLRILLTTH